MPSFGFQFREMLATVLIVSILLALLAYVLFIPVVLEADSYRNRCEVRAGFLAGARLVKDPAELFRVRLRVLFLHWNLAPTELIRASRKRTASKKSAAREQTASGKPKIRKSRRKPDWAGLIRSFRVRRLEVDLDTGNPVLNGRLYPVVVLLDSRRGNLRINFQNRNGLRLKLVNRPIRILKAFINP